MDRRREQGLTFLGLLALIDPPRPEAAEAIADAQGAGIRVVMITGDNVLTAQAIAGHWASGSARSRPANWKACPHRRCRSE